SFYPKDKLISGKLKIEQCETYKNRRKYIAKAIVLGIAVNIHEELYNYFNHGKEQIKPTLDWLKYEVPILLKKNLNIKQILYVEGLIWQRFYETFRSILKEGFILNKRVKRPPDNPINALISFGNSLIYAKTISQIYNTHLDQS